jgi:DNA-binding response OmpR family regulator
MVVDDDSDMSNIIAYVAESSGFQTSKVSGFGAFDACAEFEPDVIILDIFMPEIDGFEVLRYLGRARENPSVIIVSGKDAHFRDMAGHMCDQEGLSILASLAKPFTIEQLRTVISEAKKRHPVHAEVARAHMERLRDTA